MLSHRERVERETSPTGCVLDPQAACTGSVGVAGEQGYDPARRVTRRKRHAPTGWPCRRTEPRFGGG